MCFAPPIYFHILDDCNVLVSCWSGHVHSSPQLAKGGAARAVCCVRRNQVDLRGDVFARSQEHGLQDLSAVIRKSSAVDVEPHRSTGGISHGSSEVAGPSDDVLVRRGMFGQSSNINCSSFLCAWMLDKSARQRHMG